MVNKKESPRERERVIRKKRKKELIFSYDVRLIQPQKASCQYNCREIIQWREEKLRIIHHEHIFI